ncbi:hypothetical protein SUGI_0011530 [Cryptomeria japonica]|nr:hypothetical protein SUGI_0011530 [Cryptomeria japonica]
MSSHIRRPIVQPNLDFLKQLIGFIPEGFLVNAMDEEADRVMEFKKDEDIDGMGDNSTNTEPNLEMEALVAGTTLIVGDSQAQPSTVDEVGPSKAHALSS